MSFDIRLITCQFFCCCNRYNNKKMRKTMDPPSVKFAHIGYRATPKVGSAIMWPNVDFDDIYKQNPGTTHAADELLKGPLSLWFKMLMHLPDPVAAFGYCHRCHAECSMLDVIPTGTTILRAYCRSYKMGCERLDTSS